MRLVSAAALLVSAPFASARAQARQVVIDSRVACPTCHITFGPVRVYGTDDEPGILPTAFGALARDRRGNVWVGSEKGEGAPIVFTPDGKALRPLARRGDGPNELRGPLTIIPTWTDTVYIIDIANSRLTVATAAGGLVRQTTLPPPVAWEGEVLRSGSLVLGASASAGAMRVIDPKGQVLRTIGHMSKSQFGPGASAASRSGGIWAARPTAYVIELFDSLGTKQTVIERRADWFKPHDETIPFEVGQEPRPRIIELNEDDEGRLWVFSSVAGRDWQSALGPTRTVRGRTVRTVSDFGKYYDIMVEVLDPRTGQLLYSQRGTPPGMGRTFAPGGYVLIVDNEDDGRLRIAPLLLTK